MLVYHTQAETCTRISVSSIIVPSIGQICLTVRFLQSRGITPEIYCFYVADFKLGNFSVVMNFYFMSKHNLCRLHSITVVNAELYAALRVRTSAGFYLISRQSRFECVSRATTD